MRKLSRHMSIRLAETGYDGELTIGFKVGEHEGGLEVRGWGVRALDRIPADAELVQMSQSDFMKLITGSDFKPEVDLSPSVSELFEKAAPPKKPIFWPIDVV